MYEQFHEVVPLWEFVCGGRGNEGEKLVTCLTKPISICGVGGGELIVIRVVYFKRIRSQKRPDSLRGFQCILSFGGQGSFL